MSGRRGFTLIELLIVVSIIGLLSAIAIPKFAQARAQARASEVVGAMRAVRIAATLYFDSAGAWPPTASAGTPPAGLDGYLPRAGLFGGNGWLLRWQEVPVMGAPSQGLLQAQLSDPLLCVPLGIQMGGASSALSISCDAAGGRVTQSIER